MSDDLAAWIEALTARGITLFLRGNRLGVLPKQAYSSWLTDDERRRLKDQKHTIIAILRDRYAGTARGLPSSSAAGLPREALAPTPAPAPPPEPCSWCGRAPCIGESHPYFAVLHPHHQPRPEYSLAELFRSNAGLVRPDAPFFPRRDE